MRIYDAAASALENRDAGDGEDFEILSATTLEDKCPQIEGSLKSVLGPLGASRASFIYSYLERHVSSACLRC